MMEGINAAVQNILSPSSA